MPDAQFFCSCLFSFRIFRRLSIPGNKTGRTLWKRSVAQTDWLHTAQMMEIWLENELERTNESNSGRFRYLIKILTLSVRRLWKTSNNIEKKKWISSCAWTLELSRNGWSGSSWITAKSWLPDSQNGWTYIFSRRAWDFCTCGNSCRFWIWEVS